MTWLSPLFWTDLIEEIEMRERTCWACVKCGETTNFGVECEYCTPITFEMPLRVHNPLNNRQHWRVLYHRGQKEKAVTKSNLLAVQSQRDWKVPMPSITKRVAMVKLTRIGKRKMDSDSIPACFKHVRDTIAAWLAVDDGDETKIRFEYAQEIGKAYGVRVTIK